MSLHKVPLFQQPRGHVQVEQGATKGAVIGVNVWNADGSLYVPAVASGSTSTPVVGSTLWELVLKIPANITGLAAVTTDGWFRKDAAAIVARELLGSDLPDLADSGVGAALVKITRDAKGRVGGAQAAAAVDLPYDNTSSGLAATDVQAAIDELAVSGGGGGASLSFEMLSDSPTALWKCDETAGTTLADATGNGHDLTLSGTYSLAYSPMIESLPTTSFLRLSDASASASRAGSLGLSVPFSGDWTITAVVTLAGTSANGIRIFNITGSGETEATNTQASLTLAADYEMQAFWEHGAGTNDLTLSGLNLAEGRTFLLALRKNGTANTVDFLINGKLITSGSYANEPTGGSSVTTYIGSDAGVSTGPFTVGYVGFFPSAISNTRLAAYAIAAGLFGH